jgi:hypothetical protein
MTEEAGIVSSDEFCATCGHPKPIYGVVMGPKVCTRCGLTYHPGEALMDALLSKLPRDPPLWSRRGLAREFRAVRYGIPFLFKMWAGKLGPRCEECEAAPRR